MKNINSNWLGTPPEHWKALKLRQILRPFSEKNHADLQLLSVVREKGVIVRDTENDDNHNYIRKKSSLTLSHMIMARMAWEMKLNIDMMG